MRRMNHASGRQSRVGGVNTCASSREQLHTACRYNPGGRCSRAGRVTTRVSSRATVEAA